MFELFSVWKAVYWAIGMISIGGTILLIAFFPLEMKLAGMAVVKFFRWVFSYRVGCAIVAAIVIGFVVDYWRHSRDDAEFAERTAAFNQAQDERDKNIAARTRLEVAEELASQSLTNMDTDKDVKDFTDALPAPPVAADNPFRVGADSCKLRHVFGQAECGHRGPAQGVREADPKGKRPVHH